MERSSSGPRGATFFSPSLPTSPDIRDEIYQADASDCQRAETLCVSQISNWWVGRILSSGSIVSSPARYETSATNAAQVSSTPK